MPKISDDEYLCVHCNKIKHKDDFYKNRHSTCKECRKAWERENNTKPDVIEKRVAINKSWRERNEDYFREWAGRNPDKVQATTERNKDKSSHWKRKSALRIKYGLTMDEYFSILSGQGNKCAICHADLSKHKSCIDHDHETGQVRGILCYRCNIGLGMFNDNTLALWNAAHYLMSDEDIEEVMR